MFGKHLYNIIYLDKSYLGNVYFTRSEGEVF